MNNKYSDLKLFGFENKINSIRSGIVTPPIHVRLKPTNVCNHKCWYCGYQNDGVMTLGENLLVKDEISHHKIIEISNNLVEIGVKAVTFTGGGEPLIYKHLNESIEILLKGGIKIAVITNGSYLKGEIANLLANRASWIRISMDGWDDDSYRAYRRVGGREYTKIISNIEEFSKIKGKTIVGISMNVDKDNANHIVEFVRNIKNAGADHIKIGGCVISDDREKNNLYHKTFSKKVDEEIAKAIDQFQDDSFSIINLYHELPGRYDKNYESCPFAECLTVIAADSRVYTCQDKAYTNSGCLGSIAEISFKDFWFSLENKNALKSINPSVLCMHHCVADKKNKMLLEFISLDTEHINFV